MLDAVVVMWRGVLLRTFAGSATFREISFYRPLSVKLQILAGCSTFLFDFITIIYNCTTSKMWIF